MIVNREGILNSYGKKQTNTLSAEWHCFELNKCLILFVYEFFTRIAASFLAIVAQFVAQYALQVIMQPDQQHKARVQSFIDGVKDKVCERKPIKSIYKDSKGFSVYLGLDKNGRRVRQRFKQGEEFAKSFQKLWNNALSRDDRIVLESLTREMTIRNSHAAIKLENTPYDIFDAVEFFVKHGLPKKGRITVAEAVQVFAERKADKKTRTSKSKTGRRNHKTNFQPLTDKFGSRLLIDLSADDIEKWFREREARREKKTGSSWSPATWNSYRRVLVGFWGELARKNYCSEALNPFQQLVTRDIRDGNVKVKIIEASIVAKFFYWLEAKANTTRIDHREGMWRDIGALVLMWFCGVRSEEKDRTSWDELGRNVKYARQHKLADSTGWELSVYATEEKTTTSKILPVPEHAQKWLQLVEEKIGPLTGDIINGNFFQRYEDRKREFKKKTGHQILQNSHRHTFASHHYAFYGSEELTKRRMGHAEESTTLFQHYLTVINHSKAAPFFQIIPKETELVETWELEYQKMMKQILHLRLKSTCGKLCWDESGDIAPVVDWDESDETLEYWQPPAGVRFRSDLNFLPNDDDEVVRLLMPRHPSNTSASPSKASLL